MKFPRFMKDKTQGEAESAGERAGQLFDGGMNCAQSVLLATTGRTDPELMNIAESFGGGIGGSQCLCGAVSGGVMALALLGQGNKSENLVAAFRERNKITCCKGLSAPYRWLSREHKANCRRITVETANIVATLMR